MTADNLQLVVPHVWVVMLQDSSVAGVPMSVQSRKSVAWTTCSLRPLISVLHQPSPQSSPREGLYREVPL